MQKRFGTKPRSGVLKSILLPVGFFVAILLCFTIGLGTMTASTQAEQLRSTQQAVRRAAVHCYAVEGAYPRDLEYLENHYGLRVDKENFVVSYHAIASNLMPEINVFALTSKGE